MKLWSWKLDLQNLILTGILSEYPENHFSTIKKLYIHQVWHILIYWYTVWISWKINCAQFLGLRGPLGTPLFARSFARPRQKSKSPPEPYKSSQDHARPLIWNIGEKRRCLLSYGDDKDKDKDKYKDKDRKSSKNNGFMYTCLISLC